MKKINLFNLVLFMTSLVFIFADCSNDDGFIRDETGEEEEEEQKFGDFIPISGELSGELGPNEDYIVTDDYNTLTSLDQF